MNRQGVYSHLHCFLDQQLRGVIASEKQIPTFDTIQDKLKSIQKKLMGLKNGDRTQKKVHLGLQTSSLKREVIECGIGSNVVASPSDLQKQESKVQKNMENTVKNQKFQQGSGPNMTVESQLIQSSASKTNQSSIKKERQQSKKQIFNQSRVNSNIKSPQAQSHTIIHQQPQIIKQIDAWTPAKKLQYTPKIMSTVNLHHPSRTTQKKSKKNQTTSKKKKKRAKSYEDLYRSKYYKVNTTQKKRYKNTFNDTYSPSAIQIRVLKKELGESQKSNAQLRRRINELGGYESEFVKLKKVFDRCQQLRKHSRYNIVHK